ncbi:SDR family NAD(P)-dependent oxidoreductase [Lederbergia citri]|uniref:SDR family NAD(P)-dependent oxidoreductase n=1 Tax=Lederbergia citri TaxID=2833580 RepID=UPI002D7E412C|nr:SDR family oxidoreductase [Lederbergia citri]
MATIDRDEGIQVKAEINESGGEALFIQTDVQSEESIRMLVAETVKNYQRIDILVNNAGITLFKSLLDATIADWDLNIDLRGAFLCCKYVVKEMIDNGGGVIVNISSNHAIATIPHSEMYAAAKGGLNTMTRSMALSLGKHNIRVNAICPGFTVTERGFRKKRNLFM